MTETKYGKNFITQTKPNFVPNYHVPEGVKREVGTSRATRLAYVDDEVIKGGFYSENVWFYHGDENISVYPHKHDFDELLTFWGSDPDNPNDLNGEVELWMDDEKHIITKSVAIFVPKGLKHCPLIIRRVDRPIFHYATGAASTYHGEMA